MKCIVAMMQHETNTFSPLETPLPAFAGGIDLSTPPSGQQAQSAYISAGYRYLDRRSMLQIQL